MWSENPVPLEESDPELAEFFHTEGALLFNSGYDANIGLLSSVPQRGDRVFYLLIGNGPFCSCICSIFHF